ncbi:hypothetical protein LP420_30325 [Massilia sp. B-10]|nr:hypothetical protein LP420_30325 [Massilia sp. B-10]
MSVMNGLYSSVGSRRWLLACSASTLMARLTAALAHRHAASAAVRPAGTKASKRSTIIFDDSEVTLRSSQSLNFERPFAMDSREFSLVHGFRLTK